MVRLRSAGRTPTWSTSTATFPTRGLRSGEPGDSEYGGTGPASEPETQAAVELISTIEPELGIWYHQDLFRIAPSEGRRR